MHILLSTPQFAKGVVANIVVVLCFEGLLHVEQNLEFHVWHGSQSAVSLSKHEPTSARTILPKL